MSNYIFAITLISVFYSRALIFLRATTSESF